MSSQTRAAIEARLRDEGLSAMSWSNGPADVYSEHRHSYDKILAAVAGSITFHLPELGTEVELRAGDRLDLPAGTLHSASVGADGVTCLEAHLTAGTLFAEPRHAADGW